MDADVLLRVIFVCKADTVTLHVDDQYLLRISFLGYLLPVQEHLRKSVTLLCQTMFHQVFFFLLCMVGSADLPYQPRHIDISRIINS